MASRNFIVLDTEGVSDGAPISKRNIGANALFYDCGWIVANREGERLASFSFVNTDVFMQSELMQTAYYANKLPQYFAGLGDDWSCANTLQIWQTFAECVKQYNVRDIWAYNVGYDRASLNYTIAKQSNGFRKYFSPYGCKYRDIWDYAGNTICNTRKFVEWTIERGFTSAKGNPSTSADTVAKYVYGDLEFAEHHTALSDCECELDILLACFKRKQKAVTYDKWGNYSSGQGWRNASAIAKTL